MNYRPIGDSFAETGSSIRQNMPKIMIGKPNNPNPPVVSSPINPPTPVPSNLRDQTLENIRKWGLILTIIVIVGYAMYRMFFG